MGRERMLDGRMFATKKDLEQTVQHILWNAEISEPLSGVHLGLLKELLSHHPNFAEKAPQGIAGIVVMHPIATLSRCFFLVLPDGNVVDISFKKALEELYRR
jgi:hypothetical protein